MCMLRRTSRSSSVAAIAGLGIAAVAVLLVLSAVHLLPQLRNPFGQTTTVSSQPAILKSITELSRYEAANGEFQVVVEVATHDGILPSFLAGSDTLFVGQGSDIAYVDFSNLKGNAITINQARTTVTIKLPKAQLETPTLDVSQSYVYAEQQGLMNRVGNFFSGNPNSQQQVYILAEKKIAAAAKASALVVDAQRNTTAMLTSMLTSLGFQHIVVTYG
jgi:hypothetical protein